MEIFITLLAATAFSADADLLTAKMIEAEETIWSRFYSPITNLFYDYLTSYTDGKELAHLPTAAEIEREYPNDCGYGTGMEDCMISAGVMMTSVLNRYAVDNYNDGPKRAELIFDGIERCTNMVPGEGFVARGVSPYATKYFYRGTSRDQVTHAVSAMWEYYRSGLPNESVKIRIRRIITDIADRMIKNVCPETDFDFLRADETACPRGICKMENVQPHEAARLVMIYAAAWNMTGEKKYYDLWRTKIENAALLSLHPSCGTASYALLQMQDSLRLLEILEPDSRIRKILREAAAEASALAESRIARLEKQGSQYDLSELAPDWREVGGLVDPYRSVWYYPRECGEISLVLLDDPNRRFSESSKDFLYETLEKIDFQHLSSCGAFDLLAAWWVLRYQEQEYDKF